MKYIISRYNQPLDWLKEYTDNYVLYDRSEEPLPNSIVVPNVGSDIYDKLTYIIDNYDNLPDVAVYTKANLFKYISKEEYDIIKENRTFTPILTQHHRTYADEWSQVCYYEHGVYYERNDAWYLASHQAHRPFELMAALRIRHLKYVPFAPGSNYILPKENILKHSKDFYSYLRDFLAYDTYPGEAMIMERGLYLLWL